MIVGMGAHEWFAEVPGSDPIRAAGRVFPWSRIEIRDDEGNVLPTGSPGRIWSQSDGQIDGYLNAPAETRERFRDGWVHIGDIGKIDANGYLYLLDRANDLIISGGFNIYPSELENVIGQIPDVIEVAVFGVPHEKWGECPVAVCCVSAGSSLTESEVIDHVAEKLGSYRKPGQVVIRKEPLPRSPVGKVMRRALREPYWKGLGSNVSGS